MKKNYYKFLIPVRPDSLNKVCTYGKKDGDVLKLKHKWEKTARIYIRRAIDEDELPEYFEGKIGVHFKLYFELKRQRDGDNYNFMCKGILDAFVKENMIDDDNYNCVDDNGRRFGIDIDQARVEVHITEKVKGDKNPIIIINGKEDKKRNNNKCRYGCGRDNNIRNGKPISGMASRDGENCYVTKGFAPEQAYNDGRIRY